MTTPTSRDNLLGPLMTPYAPSPTCTIYATMLNAIGGYQAQGCGSDNNIADASTCWPSATVSGPQPPLGGWGFYSPGIICPSGYYTACSSSFAGGGPSSLQSRADVSPFSFQFPLTAEETAIGCCPSGFTCQNADIGQTCQSIATSASFLAGDCTDGTLAGFNFVSVPVTTAQGTASLQVITTANLLAPLFQLNFRAADLPTSTTSTTTSTTTTSRTSGPTPDPQPVPPPGGLSTGAKAAIGVLIPLFFITLVAVLGFLFARRRRRRHQYEQARQQLDPADNIKYEKAELDAGEAAGRGGLKTELPAATGTRTELDGRASGNERTELDGDGRRELDGGGTTELDGTAHDDGRTELYESDARSIHGVRPRSLRQE